MGQARKEKKMLYSVRFFTCYEPQRMSPRLVFTHYYRHALAVRAGSRTTPGMKTSWNM